MAFDKPTRNRLAAFVAEARRLITDEFTQQFQSLYGISDASLTELAQLGHLDDAGLAVAGLLRERIDYLVKTHPEDKAGLKAAVDRLAREQAFTVLNRLAAVRMAEKRGLIAESVGNGYQSKGFKVFEQVARSGLGEIYQRYRRYLFCLFDELAIDLGVLFDRRSPQGLLFPRENTLLDLLNLLNGPELEPLWQEDETIGWIYQYYNDPAERKKMREESAAPRNSRELAVRNQFFTPRYVVEFLTDNTLGRIWYEMTRGETQLKEQCRYLVRRPTEIFLGSGETAPELPEQEGLSQEELLRQPVYVAHRALKDPRQLRMLDPACGSMHFGLYAFDLYEVIYEEAWDRGMESLRADFPDRDALLREIPRLIIEHNIHGIDIDPRAVQIAGLSLWLRAQRSWQQQRLPAQKRPQIRRSNIVCAEPMPGDKGMLREFIASQFTPEEQPAFTFLLERVFDRMALADEAGSLLKIEEEISEAVREAKGLWKKGPQYRPGYLFAEAIPKQPEQLRLDLSGISDEGFWETAEEQIYAALQAYAKQAESDGYQRRLFAEDAAHGFAFIDLIRKHYDAVVMNPPFGSFSKLWTAQAKIAYSNSSNDILGAFVERFLNRLYNKGRLGAITSRTCFFLTSFTDWRRNVILKKSAVRVIADLGQGVMDDAMVEAAAYVLENTLPTSNMTVFRAIADTDRQRALEICLAANQTGKPESRLFLAYQQTFDLLPDSPFVYWIDNETIRQFNTGSSFEPDVGLVRVGLQTGDDPRYVRTTWEVGYENTLFCYYPSNGDPFCSFDDPIVQAYFERRKKGMPLWAFHVKSGASQPWYSPITLKLNYAQEGSELRNFKNDKGKLKSALRSTIMYHRPGFSWTRRAVRFYPYVIPGNCIPSVSRYMAFPDHGMQAESLGVCASRLVSAFLRFYAEFWQRPNFLVDTLKALPWPQLPDDAKAHFEQLISREVEQRRLAYQNHEPFHEFLLPGKIHDFSNGGKSLAFNPESLLDAETEKMVADAFGFSEGQTQAVERDLLEAIAYQKNGGTSDAEDEDLNEGIEEEAEEADSDFVLDYSQPAQEEAHLSYLLGIAFGRWDIRFSNGERPPPALPDPFDPLPACPPGMLQCAIGLPAEPKDVPTDYPMNISWTGILVDDESHPGDIIARVEEALKVIWKERWEAIEQEACELLGVKSLRDYFRKPSGFFADHIKRYSKSRRQAPIYWSLSSAKGSYTLWIYYHRLSDQTLHTALADFVDPKIKDVRAEISLLRESNNNRSRLEELLDLESELLDFQAEIERIIKLPWQPNLNDGVLITAAPLWRLFRLPKWQKDLKACWDKLEKGEYDWAHLAYSIWPKRVEEVCKKDRSIAIAHGLEHLCQVEPPKPKAKRGRKKAE